jgi:hypothetical protein
VPTIDGPAITGSLFATLRGNEREAAIKDAQPDLVIRMAVGYKNASEFLAVGFDVVGQTFCFGAVSKQVDYDQAIAI